MDSAQQTAPSPPAVDDDASSSSSSSSSSSVSSTVNVALKEWGAVVAALASGQQTVIFRKGGLKDGGKGFKLEASTFALFPTVFHPNERQDAGATAAMSASAYQLVAASASSTPDMKKGEAVPIEVVAQVTGAWVTHDAAVLEALSGHHVWSRELLASRLAWKPETPITVIELRARTISAAHTAGAAGTPGAADTPALVLPPDLELYGGCKSWVKLPFEIAVDREEAEPGGGTRTKPALSDDAFRARGVALRAALADSGIAYAPLDY